MIEQGKIRPSWAVFSAREAGEKRPVKVTVFSRDAAKRQAAMELGADGFVDLTSSHSMLRAENSVDVFIDTCPRDSGCDFLRLCKINGTLVRVGIPSADQAGLQTSWHPLIFTSKKVAGSIACGSIRTKEMLHLVSSNLDFFCRPSSWTACKIMPFSEVNEAMKQLQEQQVESFRIVLKW